MFEAHSFTSQDLFAEPVALPVKRITRTHAETLRPLSIWFVEGKRKERGKTVEQGIFVYSEYRDDRGNNCFNCQYHPYPDCLQQVDIDRFIEKAINQPLAL